MPAVGAHNYGVRATSGQQQGSLTEINDTSAGQKDIARNHGPLNELTLNKSFGILPFKSGSRNHELLHHCKLHTRSDLLLIVRTCPDRQLFASCVCSCPNVVTCRP